MAASRGLGERIGSELSREWKWIVLIGWALIAAWYLSKYAPAMHYLALGDTDDNLRYVQVRDWLAGQGWWDLTQHRMNPPVGGNIHWSRLVDLPIAALMLGLRPFVGSVRADELAIGIAPLLPLLPLMTALAFIARRLEPKGLAWAFAAALPLGAGMALGMFMPLRVDHHGWQLALTAVAVAGLVDPNHRRGGLVAGAASALSVSIGMEMLVYLAGGGAMIALRWVFKPGAARRMVPYALSLSGSTALCYLVFASNANRQPVCDALSPIWTTLLVLAGALMLLLAALPLRNWQQRLVGGALGGVVLMTFAYLVWPQCLTGAYQISAELERSWLVYVREAKPITAQGPRVWVPLIALPLTGLVCALAGAWRHRRDLDRLWAWGTIALMILFAGSLLFWQIRAAPAAQLLAIPPVAWAGWELVRVLWTASWPARAASLATLALLGCVASAYALFPKLAPHVLDRAATKPDPAQVTRSARIRAAASRCKTLPALRLLNQLPPSVIFTMVDLGPRLLATTHHSVIAGPYHRNGAAILDVHHAMDGSPERFRQIADAHGARYLLICPSFPEGTIYSGRSPRGFYAQMLRGEIPRWLEPVKLRTEATLPFRVYRIEPSAPGDRSAAKNARSSSAA